MGRLSTTECTYLPTLVLWTFPYCLSWRLMWPLAPRMSIGATAIMAQILEEKSSFQATMVWYALNCVEPSLSWPQNRRWPRAFGLVSIILGFFRSFLEAHKASICALF